MSPHWYYRVSHAAYLVRTSAIWQSKGRACQGNSLWCWYLKGQRAQLQPLVRPYTCLSVTISPLSPSGCTLPSSRLLSPIVISSELPPFDDSDLLSERSFQAGTERTVLWRGPRHLPGPMTCGWFLWRTQALCLPVHPQIHVMPCFQHLYMERRWGALGLRLLSMPSDGFNEGIWIFLWSWAHDTDGAKPQKIDV